MATSRIARSRESLSNLVMPEPGSNTERRVSLTGYSNIVLDVSNTSNINDEDKNKLRVRFATMPSVDTDEPVKRRYSVALQTLKPFRPSSTDGKLPINRAGFFSYISVSWLSPLIWKMFKNRHEPIKESDIWACSDQEGVKQNTERLIRLWENELKVKGPDKASFTNVWLQFIKTRLLVLIVIIALFGLASFFSSAFLVNYVLSYLESSEDNIPYGVGLACAMFGSEILRATSFANLFTFGGQTGTRFRSGFMGILYDKLLRMKNIKGKTNSEIITAMSVDSYRVYLVTLMFSTLVAVPIFIIIATVYCYVLIGEWCFVPIGTFILCYGIQMMMTKALQKLRKRTSQFTDQRDYPYPTQKPETMPISNINQLTVRRMGEILNSMKFIKMYSWEEAFTNLIKGVRMSEQKYLLYSGMVNAVTSSIIPITPTLASVVTISVYTAAGNPLTASLAFAIVGTMNFLRIIVGLIPFAMRLYGEAQVSFQRIQRLLLANDYTEPSDDCFNKDNLIEVKGSNFVWDLVEQAPVQQLNFKNINKKKKKRKNSAGSVAGSRRESINPFALTDIDLEVKRGSLIGICGEVGCGKSSLISAILGRMQQVKGHLAVNGSMAYVSQQAWIFNDSLKENILFGKEYNAQRYKEVLTVCGLDPDIALLVDGDQTEIGERGSNLSGGQKQRVNLARAVYSDSDIYLLDDPMSALDVRVGKQIFDTCIKNVLRDKTVILVTHQLQYLKHCDVVVVMDEGCIVESGSHLELLDKGGLYTDMYTLFDNTTIKAKKPVGEGPNDVVGLSYIKKKETTPSINKDIQGKPATNGKHTQGIRKKEKRKLVLSEEIAVGSIGFGTFNSYIKSAGGWCIILLVLGMYVISAGSVVFTDWWLSEWIGSLTQPGSALPTFNATARDDSRVNITTNETRNLANVTSELPQKADSSTWLSGVSYDTFFLVYVVSIGGVVLTTLTKGFVAAKTYINASNNLHTKCLDKVMKSPMSFFDANPAGRVLNRFSKDLDESDVFIPQVTDSFLTMFCTVLLSIGLTTAVIPYILIAVVILFVIFYLLKQISTIAIRNLKRLENVSRSPLLSHVNSTSQGLSTIVAYKQQDRFFDVCAGYGDVASMVIYLFDVSMRWIAFRLDLLAGMINVLVALIFVFSKGAISPASAGLVFGLCGKTVSIVQFMIRLMNEAEARFTSVERLNEYGTKLVSEAQHGERIPAVDWPDKGTVMFNQVVMRYRPDMDPVLRGISFQITPREKVGVVGRTGAGKSSLAAALFRLVELSSGQILVDGEDISKLHLNVIRSKISTIPQDPVLFNGTIRYNVDPFGNISDHEIWEALEKVHMREKVDRRIRQLPEPVNVTQLERDILRKVPDWILQYEDEGLDVMIEENGENFSVGERQLICLARAVVRKSKILLLDEATANIDTTTDALIQETIRTCFHDCTVITIAHRLNTVLHSDRIVVLDSGQVMECDTPQRLLSNQNSFFNAMIAAQSVKTPSP